MTNKTKGKGGSNKKAPAQNKSTIVPALVWTEDSMHFIAKHTVSAMEITYKGMIHEGTETLCKRLLAIGGDSVAIPRVYYLATTHILPGREVIASSVRLEKGDPDSCDVNVATLWSKHPDKYTIMSGYYLKGGTWIHHSWLMEGNDLIETVSQGDKYFGWEFSRPAASRWSNLYIAHNLKTNHGVKNDNEQ